MAGGQAVRISQEEADRLAERYPDDPDVQAQLRGVTDEPEAAEEDTSTVPSGNGPWDTIDRFLHPPAAEPEPEPEPEVPTTPFADTERVGAEIERRAAPERVHLLNAGQPVGRLAGQIAKLPTPGGLLPWIAVLLVLTFALVAVNGKSTRLELLWRGLTGGAQLPYDAQGLAIQQAWDRAGDPMTVEARAETLLAATASSGFWGTALHQLGIGGSTGSGAPPGAAIGAMGTTADGAPLGPLPAAGMLGDWGRLLGDGSGLGGTGGG